jgi:predicted transposase YbfD/YdcC
MKKSNEITAIAALLDRIELAGATVTIDAMGFSAKLLRNFG